MKIAELMTSNVRTCSPDDTLNRAAQIMWENDCGAVPIVDDEGRITGILTDRDVCMAAYTQGKPLAEIPVGSAAAKAIVSARPDDTVETVATRMQDAQVRRVPIVDDGGHIVGIVALGDIARQLSLPTASGGAVTRKPNGLSADPVARTLAAISQPRTASRRAELVYRVQSVDGGFEVFDREGKRVSERLMTQADAVIHAKELARRAGSAQIIVYGERGKVLSEFFYQRDERSTLASDDSVRSMAASHPVHTHSHPR